MNTCLLSVCYRKAEGRKNTGKKEDLEVFREVAETFIKSLTCKHLLDDLAAAIGHCTKQTLPGIHPLWALKKHD